MILFSSMDTLTRASINIDISYIWIFYKIGLLIIKDYIYMLNLDSHIDDVWMGSRNSTQYKKLGGWIH